MKKVILPMAAAVASLLAVAAASQAQTQGAVRTFVSGEGTDSGTCTVAAPCRSFAYAITQTGNEGEVVVLNSAGYGSVTIGQSVSITNPGGVEAGVSAGAGGTGITDAAGQYSTVNLSGLTIEGGGSAATGISLTGGGILNILGCVVRDATKNGIALTPGVGVGANVTIADTTVTNNGQAGIYSLGGGYASGLQLNLSHDKVIANGLINNGVYGIELIGVQNAYFTTYIDNTLIAGNGVGLAISTQALPNVVSAVLTASSVVNNGHSLNIGSNTAMTLEKTTIGNWGAGTGINTEAITNNGTLYSFGDNAILDTLTGNDIKVLSPK